MSYSKNDLVNYRLERAKESFEDGQILTEKDRWNAAANRMYYACFYIVSAYLAQMNLRATTHAGLKATFNKYLVATGKIKKEDAKIFNQLFGIRQEADYEDFVNIEANEIQPIIPKVKQLIDEIEDLIRKNRG